MPSTATFIVSGIFTCTYVLSKVWTRYLVKDLLGNHCVSFEFPWDPFLQASFFLLLSWLESKQRLENRDVNDASSMQEEVLSCVNQKDYGMKETHKCQESLFDHSLSVQLFQVLERLHFLQMLFSFDFVSFDKNNRRSRGRRDILKRIRQSWRRRFLEPSHSLLHQNHRIFRNCWFRCTWVAEKCSNDCEYTWTCDHKEVMLEVMKTKKKELEEEMDLEFLSRLL